VGATAAENFFLSSAIVEVRLARELPAKTGESLTDAILKVIEDEKDQPESCGVLMRSNLNDTGCLYPTVFL